MIHRIHRRAGLGVALACVLGLAAACTPGADQELPEIVSVTHVQQQAVPDFDSSEQTTTDPDQLTALHDTLEQYDMGLDYDSSDDQCPGGLSTELEIDVVDGSTHHTVVGGCDDSDGGVAVRDLVRGWRAAA